jgi:hypothetical protein
LTEAKAIADKMTDEERKVFADSLTASLSAAKTGSPQQRLANIQAAASSSDPKKKQAFNLAVNSLRKLGYEIDQIAASGSTKEIEDVMKKYSWDQARRVTLKSQLLAIGAIA